MPFSGVLTRVGVPSDGAPNGSGGKRVLLTHEAAERALPSLLGMGVGLTASFDGHDAQNKIGLITAAHIDGDALVIEGFIYAADFPRESLRIHLGQADLGFSFEAQQIAVESLDADPLVVIDCTFTGAAILMKDAAAYRTTSLAAAAAQAQEASMDAELKAALTEIVAGAVTPLNATLTDAVTRLGAMESNVAAITERVEANAAIVAKAEPVARALEASAAAAEQAGINGDALRQQAERVRADASRGRLLEGISFHAAAPQQHQQQPAKIEDDPAFKALSVKLEAATAALEAAQAQTETEKAAAADKVASLETKLTDLQAAATRAAPAPDRKTLSPAILGVLAKAGVGSDADGNAKLTVAQIDAALASSNMATSQRMNVKLAMQKQGLVLDGTSVAPTV
jgi:hypothetical protein